MAYVDCIRCGQIKRTTEVERSICTDCREIELSDYVLSLLSEDGAHDGFYRRVRDKARQLGLLDSATKDDTVTS